MDREDNLLDTNNIKRNFKHPFSTKAADGKKFSMGSFFKKINKHSRDNSVTNPKTSVAQKSEAPESVQKNIEMEENLEIQLPKAGFQKSFRDKFAMGASKTQAVNPKQILKNNYNTVKAGGSRPGNSISTTAAMTGIQGQTTNNMASTNHIDNWDNFNSDYNDLGLNTHLESYSYKQELIRQANRNYKEADSKKSQEKQADLETTLEINKGLIEDLMKAYAKK